MNKKRFSLCLVVMLALLIMPMSVSAAGANFSDINGHWGKDAITYAVEKGLFTGVSDNAFSPDTSMTRGMFVTVLGRMHGVDAASYSGASFSDVKTNVYYAPYIRWAADNNIVNGLTPTTFGPEESVTREQAATILARYMTFAGTAPDTGTVDVDHLADGNYTVSVEALKYQNTSEYSMANQFLTEKARLTVENGVITLKMTWHGTQYITMDMIEGLWYELPDGSFIDVPRAVSADNKTMDITIAVADMKKATIFQVYAPVGMGETRPKFEFTLKLDTLTAAGAGFADSTKVSSWAKDSVEAMQIAGIFKGDEKNQFNPQNNITRAEAATIFARLTGFEG